MNQKNMKAAVDVEIQIVLDIVARSENMEEAYVKLVKWLDCPGSERHIQACLRNYDSIKENNKHRNTKLYKAMK